MNKQKKLNVRLLCLFFVLLILAACGGPLSTPSQNVDGALTTQAFPTCGAVAGYSTYVTYSSSALRVCRIATPGPYDADPDTAGVQTPAVDPSYAYVVFARMGSGGATVGHSWQLNQTTGTNPLLDEFTVRGWFNKSPANTQITINGAFFDCTEACFTNASHASFPIYYANSYITLGNNTSTDDQYAKRALCFDSTGGFASYKTWTLGSTNSTLANVNAYQAGCPNLIVGFAPTERPQYTKQPLTYVGIRSSNTSNDTLCFYVGGYQTRAKAQQDLSNFGCTPAVQMDGGNSSQMTLRLASGVTDPVRSIRQPQVGYGDRLVPHAFQIRF